MNLRRLVLLGPCLVCFFCLEAQIGVGLAYFNEAVDDLQINNTTVSTNIENYHVNLHYEIGLKNFRVNFLPGLDYTMAIEQDINEQTLKQSSIGISVPVRAYVLSIDGDCNCPTFSQSSNFFSKGFFFELYTAIRNFKSETNNSETDDLNYLIGLGLGLDIGISEQFTCTIFAKTGRMINQSIGNELAPFVSEDELSSFNNLGLELKYYLD